MSTKLYAVITGDIVKSSKLTAAELEKLPGVIAEALGRVPAVCPPGTEIPAFSIFRGDSFQILTPPDCALKTLILVRAGLRTAYPKRLANAVDVRSAIAIGRVEKIAGNITESIGEAFTLSGHLLDKMPRNRQTIFTSGEENRDKELNTALSLADEIIRKWTAGQAELVKYLMKNASQVEISAKTGISQPSARSKIKTMGWQGISDLLVRYEELV